ncbi:hypothetical protein N866_12815 [Actinotalea ferrariae CF5-4]|uniref:PRC-barrel domain-containing protein n=1 Tax=Actinotalea ferrariae CF5-4 TaxID=948458 RepID=A0A021VPP4_9CELL|nr:PRC-barrel domain-containing protein [Actinotalea ferrariae]EYR62005.1 hypothetical protein N866_12815 [Actinotalea ferrariae CF5-4]
MITADEIQDVALHGGPVTGPDGKRLGTLRDVFLDGSTGRPSWGLVTVGRLRREERFVPLDGAELDGDAVRVPYGRDLVHAAPRVDDDSGRLAPEEEALLLRHYGFGPAADDDASTRP